MNKLLSFLAFYIIQCILYSNTTLVQAKVIIILALLAITVIHCLVKFLRGFISVVHARITRVFPILLKLLELFTSWGEAWQRERIG